MPTTNKKIIIAGSRTFDDYELLRSVMFDYLELGGSVAIVCGEARGADALGRRFAEEYGLEILSYPADWDTHGKRAGFLRNAEMGQVSTEAIVFMETQGTNGSKHMIEYMTRHNKPCLVIKY